MPNCIGRIDCDGFVQICQKLLQIFVKHFDDMLQAHVERRILDSGRKARLERDWLAEAKSVFLPSPRYEVHIIDTPTGKEFLNSATGYISTQRPCPDPRSFSSMALTAAKILLPCLCFCLEEFIQKQAPEKLRQSCESVIDATSIFTVLEGEHGPTKSSDLDEILALAHSISLHDEAMGARPTWLGPPYEDLKLVQEEYYGLLRLIQGFLGSRSSPTLKDLENSREVSFTSLLGSRFYCGDSLETHRFAELIEHKAAVCRNLRMQIQDCRGSKNRNSMAKQMNIEGRKALAEVRTLQLSENVWGEHPRAILHIRSAEGLKKTGTFTGRSIPM